MSYTKTTWVNNSSPYINATNLNNIENGVEANDIAITNITGHVLWTNPNPTNSIDTDTTINLSDSDYDVYEVIYAYNNTNAYQLSVKAQKGKGTLLLITYNDTTSYRRTLECIDDTTFKIKAQEQSQNQFAIPEYIIGYKTGLF